MVPQGERPPEPPYEVEDGPVERRYPSTIGGALYLAMLAVVLVGILVVVFGSWRVGIRIFAGALVAGAALRLALKEQDAGMLAVRSKPVDVGLYLVVAASLATLASVIPDQPV
ncbi:DUF3017 domain-containing protein [Nocardioides jishulii]|uniref:DUF3017 domain-containing protein n=1 Tax=Nocardioides jishulii TaxID=2575440 RepID=A0A4U2YUZ3_9ACTN|nr:DUF3017 domain-containing protein [Nocardioides jishulii]QCX28322.1 DUF3017 domain-containing protein [Nocardioides jishulii]TKI64785.1 DUF3017 domain-containing protein [Nocardioides jishulii]